MRALLERAHREARRRRDHPAGRRGLALLAGFAGHTPPPVVARAGIGSARIRPGPGGPIIEVDPHFHDTYLHHDEDALHLLAHELLHRVRGDLSRLNPPDRATWQLFNLALDVFVDAQLERIWFRGEGAPYQRLLYAHDRFPDLLLLPPRAMLAALLGPDPSDPAQGGDLDHDLDHDLEQIFTKRRSQQIRDRAVRRLVERLIPHLAALDLRDPPTVARLYADAWLNHVSFATFWRRFRDALDAEVPTMRRRGPPLLLGSHGPMGEPDPLAQQLAELLQATLGRGLHGGSGGAITQQDLQPDAGPPDPGPILNALRLAVDRDPHNPITRLLDTPSRGVVGRPGRRELLALAHGSPPTFWPTTQRAPLQDDDRVALYLDSSGSMAGLLPFLFRLVGSLGEHVGRAVYMFSNQVVETSLQDVKLGRYQTTFGTDFDCVITHALAARRRRILVITDGYAGLQDALASAAQQAGLRVFTMLFGPNIDRDCVLSDLPGRTWCFDPGTPTADDEIPF